MQTGGQDKCAGYIILVDSSGADVGVECISQGLFTLESLNLPQISQPHRDQSSNETISNTPDCKQNSTDSTGAKEMEQVAREAGPVSSEEARIVPVKPPRNRVRVKKRIWSSALTGQLENITNSSSEVGGTTKVVQAQIEGNPVNCASSQAFEPFRCDYGNSSRNGSSQNHLKPEKARKLSSGFGKKWKNLKKALISSSSEQPTLFKGTETDNTERLNVPARTLKPYSPLQYSAMLQKSRLVDASTSTRISANARAQNDETVAKRGSLHNNVETHSTRNDSPYPNTGTLQEVASLINDQSVDGKLLCDVSIRGLAMNQAQFLDLFEASEGSTRTASIVTTEEASIISIKFHRPRNTNENLQTSDTSFFECPLKKLYKNLPEIFEISPISKLFKSQEVSERSNPVAPSIHVSDHSRSLNNSRNETSYIAFPNVTNRFVADESVSSRKRTLSKRFGNSHTTRFTEERRI
ncbi:PREDICTED: uncharacterized protein LOC108570421 [Habropoda laboriosa]|uniref:uncharacterized protein LOC108570421 n=1 Tax=Habropoda laboriosa TaxID=597456 RepID=UPI00083DF43E|nr:PREDICTED: uncharacterized protein LOC108570421 [Habropoda laboriosa]